MKFHYVAAILLCLVAGYSQAGVTKEEMDEAFKAISANCKQETGASDSDIDAIIKHQIDSTPEGKCLRACLMMKFDVITADHQLVKDNIMKIADLMMKGDPEKMKVAGEIVDSCMGVTDADKCEAAHKIAKCLKEGADAKGLEVTW